MGNAEIIIGAGGFKSIWHATCVTSEDLYMQKNPRNHFASSLVYFGQGLLELTCKEGETVYILYILIFLNEDISKPQILYAMSIIITHNTNVEQ